MCGFVYASARFVNSNLMKSLDWVVGNLRDKAISIRTYRTRLRHAIGIFPARGQWLLHGIGGGFVDYAAAYDGA